MRSCILKDTQRIWQDCLSRAVPRDSLPVSNMVANGMEVNMESPGSADRDWSVLDYSRLNSMTIQAWSPFQAPNWGGCFLGTSAIRI